jgi:hypothetical protein
MNDKQFRETVRGLYNPETRPEGIKDTHISVVVYLLQRNADEQWVRVDPETMPVKFLCFRNFCRNRNL